MDENDLVSVIMPTYNRGYIISKAIESILVQTYSNFEFIIVDDCSSDDTETIVSDYQKRDKRIKYIKLEKNSGANVARNIGLDQAKGNYITFQDSDDISMDNRIEIELKALKKQNADWVFSSFKRINNKKEEIMPAKQIRTEELHNILLYKNLVTTQVLFAKSEIFEQIKFDNELPRFQDWDLVIRMSEKYKGYHINQVLLHMYIQNDSITKNPLKGKKALEVIKEKYKDKFNNKQLARLYCRIGIFCVLSNEEAKASFKKCLQLDKNIKYYIIYILYKLKILKIVYGYIKR